MNLVFWHNLISPHQAPYMRALAENGHDILLVASEDISPHRRQMGWAVPDLGSAQVVLDPDPGKVDEIVRNSTPDAIHFIAGARGTPLGGIALHACREHKRRTGIVTESPDPRSWKGALRKSKYAIERLRAGSHFDFLLCMGEKGIRWFKECGYPESVLFPFAYVTDRATATRSDFSDNSSGGGFRIIYVGQLIPRKGVDFLIKAFARAAIADARLLIVGTGPSEKELRSLSTMLGIDESMDWIGNKSADEIPELMAGADMMVLPSREDGWGAVVNESLMVGTPVICSDACGAAELIRHPWLGGVFRSGDVAQLATLLRDWSVRKSNNTIEHGKIQTWTQCIEGRSVAGYVEDIMEHVYGSGARPVAPWRKDSI